MEIQENTPPGLIITKDGSLLNWQGQNYVRQAQTTTEEQS